MSGHLHQPISPRLSRALILLVIPAALCAQDRPAYLVKSFKELTYKSTGMNPGELISCGDQVFFLAGEGLWRTDGTRKGTMLLRHIPVNVEDPPLVEFEVLGNTLFFCASYWGKSYCGIGRGLWRSDGTVEGTYLLKDINPHYLTGVGNSLYFCVWDTDTGESSLWKSDGTEDGTVLVKRVLAGYLTALGDVLYFTVNGENGDSLWRSDGTEGGTVPVHGVAVSRLTAVGNTLFFEGWVAASGHELWKSDGTSEGTVMVKDIYPGANSSAPSSFMAVGDTLFFSARDGGGEPELWRSDGTAGGTRKVGDIYLNKNTLLGHLGGTLFLFKNGENLWRSDGTAGGTVMIRDLKVSWMDQSSMVIGNTLFFAASGENGGMELWKSDGTAGGTALVRDIHPGDGPSTPRYFAAVGDTLFFSTDDGTNGSEIWKSDGTAEGTVMVTDVEGVQSIPGLDIFTHMNGWLYFTVGNSGRPEELWRSDGTATHLVREIGDILPSSYSYYEEGDDKFFFVAYGEDSGFELWRSDGTRQGTFLVKDIYPGIDSSSLSDFVGMGGQIFFNCYRREQLWRSDGTAGGTVKVWGSGRRGIGMVRHSLTRVGDTLFFSVDGPLSDRETGLWRSDGTAEGTFRFFTDEEEIGVENNWSTQDFTPVGNTLFFRRDGRSVVELWRSDGTPGGTGLVKDIRPGSSSSPIWLTGVGSTVFFWARDTEVGEELWKSDGTAGGTVLVKDILPGTSSPGSGPLLGMGDQIFFSTTDGIHGSELWRSDGTAEGTVLVSDIAPGTASSCISSQDMAAINGVLFLAASDGVSGSEPWAHLESLGTTFLLRDIAPGPASSHPGQFTPSSQGIFFRARHDGVSELWLLPGDVSSEPGNAPPEIVEVSTTPDPVQVHTAVSLSAEFIDGDWYAYIQEEPYLYTAVVEWGDGSPLEPLTVARTPGGGSVTAEHVYAAPGSYTLTLTVRDPFELSRESSLEVTVTVDRVPPPARDLGCRYGISGVVLWWTNGAEDYDTVEIHRDGSLLETVSGDSETFTDETDLEPAVHAYEVVPLYEMAGSLDAPSCAVDTALPLFVRGEVNSDGTVNLTDVIVILGYLFLGEKTPPCLEAIDTNDDDTPDLADAVRLLNFLFTGLADSPPAPFPECGVESNPEKSLGCASYPPCAR